MDPSNSIREVIFVVAIFQIVLAHLDFVLCESYHGGLKLNGCQSPTTTH